MVSKDNSNFIMKEDSNLFMSKDHLQEEAELCGFVHDICCCNSGTDVLEETSQHLIGFKAHSMT